MAVGKNLVLGGSGTIGRELCKYLSSLGEIVINLDIKEGFDLRIHDLTPFYDFDFVWFLAWDVGGAKYLYGKKHQIEILKNNTSICRSVFAYLEKSKIPFLFASSQLASTDTSYGITKLLGELWTNQLNGKIVRFWNVYGWEEPSEKTHVIPDLVIQALTKGEIALLTNGNEERQFILVSECVKNLYKIRKENETMFHLTDGNWIKIKDIAHLIGEKLKVPVHYGSKKGHQIKIEPKAYHGLFEFNVNISDGIDIIIQDAKQFLNMQ